MSEKERPQEIIPKEITRLLDRRATLGRWLAKLDELRGTVRPEVHDRVRNDYEQRLGKNETELAAHRSDMEAALGERHSRVSSLDADRSVRAAELEEAELRHAVGEYAEGEFKKRKEKHDRALAELDAELEADRRAQAKLEEVVGVLSSLGTGAPAAAAPGWLPEAAAKPTAEPAAGDQRPATKPEREEAKAKERKAERPEVTGAEAAKPESGRPEAAPSEPEPVRPREEEAAAAVAGEAPGTAGEEGRSEEPLPAAAATDQTAAGGAKDGDGAAGDYMDDLEFLESLSLEEIDSLDPMSSLLEEESESEGEGAKKGPEKS